LEYRKKGQGQHSSSLSFQKIKRGMLVNIEKNPRERGGAKIGLIFTNRSLGWARKTAGWSGVGGFR